MAQLTDRVYTEVTALCKLGDDLVKIGDLEAAKERYVAALRLLPEKYQDWDASTWIYVAIGDIHFRMKNFEKAFKCFFNAVQCPKGLGNPFIHLRLGQLYFEQGNFHKAIDELTRAHMGADIKIFMEDDPKYLEFLESKIQT